MRITSSMPSFYNAGRVNGNDENLRVNRIEKVNPVEEAKGISSLTEQRRNDSDNGSRGVVNTKVFPENSFQKAMVTDASFAYERMAGKLLDKLPNILRDIEKLPAMEEKGFDVAAAAEKIYASENNSKVVIGEDGKITGQKASVPETEDISL